MPKLRRLAAVVALSAGMLALALPAHAEDPVDLSGAYVLDSVGAISGEEAEVTAALDDLYERARIQLFVVYVSTFDNPASAIDWADETAVQNNLGANDLLLAVAVDDRQYAISVDPAFTLSDSQLDSVESAIEGRLRDSDWSGAAIAGAQELEAQATGVVGPGPTTPTDAPAPGSGGGIPVLPIVGGAVVAGVGAFVISRVRRRQKENAGSSPPDQLTQKQLDQRAGSLLVQLDDSLKTSEQELGFAVAQFGDAATADFTATLASAKAKVAQAFTLRQKLDDAQPDSEADQRAWTLQIIELCEAADTELDAQADAFDELRQLEKNAPQELVAVRAAIGTATTRRDAAASALANLESTYSVAATKPVSDNIAQARKLLDFAGASADAAQKAIDGAKPSEAAIAVRTAQASVGQATALFDAIDALGTNLADATAKLKAAVADTQQDIAAAKALAPDAALTPLIAAASEALASAPEGDPVAGLAVVAKANGALEAAFTGVRDQQERVARAVSQLDATLSGARTQLQSATEYITTRRGGIGSTARTRVSEAERMLAEATGLAASDPVAALAAAEKASSLAWSALQSARADVSSYENRESAVSYDNDNYPGSDGADLGGILGDWLFGGGGGGGGGSSWSSGRSGSSYRSSSSGRSSRSGSFGGSSRSSGRRSSSGGGRSRGGRF